MSATHAAAQAAAASLKAAVGGATTAAGAATSATVAAPQAFNFGYRFTYLHAFRRFTIRDFVIVENGQVNTVAHTFRHHNGTVVTLIPTIHMAHPSFFRQVDSLCCQHESVLMEGRIAHPGSITVVPPRKMHNVTRPAELEDSEGWEPLDPSGFFQPFSWGVADSPVHTVVHAADAYDAEKLPFWMGIRSNLPLVGSLKRERQCFSFITPLAENGYRSFAVPWGAAHMPVMSTMLERNGFSLISKSRLVAFDRIDGITSDGWYKWYVIWDKGVGSLDAIRRVGTLVASVWAIVFYVTGDHPNLDSVIRIDREIMDETKVGSVIGGFRKPKLKGDG